MYAQLSTEARNARTKLWKFSPKHHLFQHLCEWQSSECGNPRYYWVYADEDLVGKIISIAHSCHPSTMSETSMWKWSLWAFEDIESATA